MTELRRRSDTDDGQPDLSAPATPLDPVEKRHIALLNQHIERSRALADAQAEIQRLYELAYFDKLTGLANQRLLETSFDEAVAKDEKIVLLFIDLNKFKQINDTHGHDVGDEALKLASKTLASLTRSTDVIAHIYEDKAGPQNHLPVRYAGDEFIILFTGATLPDLQRKITEVKKAFSNLSLKVGEENVPVGASIGAYEYQKGDTLEHCKKQADIAMYADKKASRLDSTTLAFGRFSSGYNLPAATGYIPLTNFGAPKPEPS